MTIFFLPADPNNHVINFVGLKTAADKETVNRDMRHRQPVLFRDGAQGEFSRTRERGDEDRLEAQPIAHHYRRIRGER